MAVDDSAGVRGKSQTEGVEAALELAPVRGGQFGQGSDVRRERFSGAVQASLLGR